MASPHSSSQSDSAIGAALQALLAPWSFTADAPRISTRTAMLLAGFHVAVGAGLSVLLSTWTYLIGKGVLMKAGEMDMGMDDLPADSIRQVASGFVGAFCVWIALLGLAIGVAVAVADFVYGADRAAFRVAVRRAGAATVWFVIWAAAVLVINSIHHRELRHPAAAVRAYAQNHQHWFTGSSATGPGPVAPEPLAARGRMRGLVLLFPLMWSLSLPPSTGRPRAGRAVFWVSAFLLSWVAWWGVWRLLPWIALETLAG